MATRAMAMAMRLAGNKKAREGCKGDGDSNVTVVGDKEGNGNGNKDSGQVQRQ